MDVSQGGELRRFFILQIAVANNMGQEHSPTLCPKNLFQDICYGLCCSQRRNTNNLCNQFLVHIQHMTFCYCSAAIENGRGMNISWMPRSVDAPEVGSAWNTYVTAQKWWHLTDTSTKYMQQTMGSLPMSRPQPGLPGVAPCLWMVPSPNHGAMPPPGPASVGLTLPENDAVPEEGSL